MTPRASPLRSVIAPRNTFPLCQVHIFSTSLSLSILRAAQHFFIIAVATVHQRLFTTPRTTTGWNQSTGRTTWNQSTQARPPEPLIFGRGLLLHTNPVSSSARPQSGEKGAVVAIGELPKFYVEFNCLDHEDIAQSFKFDSRLRIGPRAPKALLRLFKPIVWSRTIWLVYHELMPEALPVP